MEPHDERVQAALDDLLAELARGVSHDLRAPVRKIRSFAQLVARRAEGQLDESTAMLFGHLQDATGRLERMLEDFVEYARVVPGPPELEAVPLDEALDDVLPRLSPVLARRGGRLTRDPLPVVRADPRLARRLLLELLGNALSFSGDRPPQVHVGAEGAEVYVRDRGAGIDPAVADQVFRAFRRLDASTSGSGLGLAVCRRIAERHGGWIRVESVPGEGATFRFVLGELLEPARAAAVEAAGSAIDEVSDEVAPVDPSVFDRELALSHCYGDEALLAEISGLFVEKAPELLDEARRAVDAGDAGALHRSTHQLKSMAGSVGGTHVAGAAARLSTLGRNGDLTDADEELAVLLAEAERLLPVLAGL